VTGIANTLPAALVVVVLVDVVLVSSDAALALSFESGVVAGAVAVLLPMARNAPTLIEVTVT
jgi:hypothetical protein